MNRVLPCASLLLAMVLIQGCGGRSIGANALPSSNSAVLATAKSVSPASFKAAPMAQTPHQPSSSMMRRPQSDIQPLGWTTLPGGAVQVVASSDGTLWALSTAGNATDKYVYHYDGSTWTNISGAVSRLAIAPDQTLWGVTAAGGIYKYYGGSWSPIAGGASDISVGPDGSVYVISNQPGGQYGNGIWHYVNGTWTQMPGAGVRIAASPDPATYPTGIAPNGFYVTNTSGSIYYYTPGSGFSQIAGTATELAPTKTGGLFALGYPSSTGGMQISYENLMSATWSTQPGAALSITTDGTSVYVVGRGNGIYKSPVQQTLQYTPASIRYSQSWLYAPGGSQCPSSPDVKCDSLWPENYETDITPTEQGGHSGTWTLHNASPAVAFADNCPVYASSCTAGTIAVEPQDVGFDNVTITGQHPGNSNVLPVSVTETTLAITLNSIPGANTVTASSNCFPTTACPRMPTYTTTITTQPASGSYTYTFVIKNYPFPVGVKVSDITIQVYNSGATRFGQIVNPTITEGQTNTFNFSIN